MTRNVSAALVVLLLSACAGAEGPAVPQGATGPQGPPGAPAPAGASRLIYVGLIPAGGSVSAMLPASAGTSASSPPAVSCWTSNSNAGPWLAVADGYSSTSAYCGVGNSGGVWTVLLLPGTPGWYAAITTIY